ncbi:MAG TPA: tail fiber protein [Candidatus Saccharimonadales bacterium]|nr:tail fiber protein [Candidatus Saccharimonadales bacterium]
MSSPYLSEIRIVSFNFPPKGWAFCNGQILPINQNQALFALLGTTYGGNGVTTFALPNLQGCVPMHVGSGFNLGQSGGEAAHTLAISEIPNHTHPPVVSSNPATQGSPQNNFFANGNQPAFNPTPTAAMSAAVVGSAGGTQPHNNMQPYLVLSFIIALQGIFPSQN